MPPSITNLAEAAAYLEALINVEKRPDWPYRRFTLEPIEALLARLGNPERGLSTLHIAGSKGKGSTALFAEAILREQGSRTGTFTSPHLERWTERFRIAGEEVAETDLARAVARVAEHVEALRAESAEVAPTFFDATTAVAWLLFAEARVDHVILEVGLGGRLDSTNACRPAVTCVTSIELEHTDRLGDTLAAIAGEKAGILKPGVPAVVGRLPAEALTVVEARAREVAAPLFRLDHEIRLDIEDRGLEGSRIRVADDGVARVFEVASPGAAASHNAALAVACVQRLEARADVAEAAARALAATRLPGRIEVVSRSPWVVVDAAHTEASARVLAGWLDALDSPIDLVLSVSGDKDLDAMLGHWLGVAHSVTATRADPHRSLDAVSLAERVEALAPGLPLRVEPDPDAAIVQARRRLAPDRALCVAGSVYLAGIARRALRELDAAS